MSASPPTAARKFSAGQRSFASRHSEEVDLGDGVVPPVLSSTTGRNFRPVGVSDGAEQFSCYDNYGFRVTVAEKAAEDLYNKENAYEPSYIAKWERISLNWNRMSHMELKKYCRKGIPQSWRGVVWQQLLGTYRATQEPSKRGVYIGLCEANLDQKICDIIERDLDRTFPTHRLFEAEGQRDGQAMLRRILHAYACHNSLVGYCQGMGFLAATLLLQLEDEEKTFWAFCALMERYPYQLEGLYEPGFPQLRCCFHVLSKLLHQQSSRLNNRLVRCNIDPSFYATHWFMTLFSYHFNFALVSRIWDMFLCEGWKPIYRISLALLLMDQKRLLSQPTETDILMQLRDIQEQKNPVALLKKAQSISFKTSYVQKVTHQYRHQ